MIAAKPCPDGGTHAPAHPKILAKHQKGPGFAGLSGPLLVSRGDLGPGAAA